MVYFSHVLSEFSGVAYKTFQIGQHFWKKNLSREKCDFKSATLNGKELSGLKTVMLLLSSFFFFLLLSSSFFFFFSFIPNFKKWLGDIQTSTTMPPYLRWVSSWMLLEKRRTKLYFLPRGPTHISFPILKGAIYRILPKLLLNPKPIISFRTPH